MPRGIATTIATIVISNVPKNTGIAPKESELLLDPWSPVSAPCGLHLVPVKKSNMDTLLKKLTDSKRTDKIMSKVIAIEKAEDKKRTILINLENKLLLLVELLFSSDISVIKVKILLNYYYDLYIMIIYYSTNNE